MRINMLDYWVRTVAEKGGETAVVDSCCELTFTMLDARSRILATVLVSRLDGEIKRPIAVYMKKSVHSIVSDIAITYSGNAYMNLDVKTPAARLSGIIDLIQPALVLTDALNEKTLSAFCPPEMILNVEGIHWDNAYDDSGAIEAQWARLIDTDPLCIINTSGSTGVPKGVVLNHRSFIDFAEWAKEVPGIGDKEVVGSLSPIVFDIFSFELCMLMAKGSTLILLDGGLAAFPAKLMQILAEKKVTFIFWVPTIMVNIANMGLLERIPLPYLKTVWFAGEVFPTKQFNVWHRNLPDAKFINLYGPIEITLDCTYFIVDRKLRDDEPIPIGSACKNTEILILNDEDKLCGVNEEGELWVRGTSLAMGYYNNPEKTALAFVQNPLNHSYPELIYRTGDIAFKNERGEIIFKGRKDTLVKHLGYRIELGEIEHVIINTLKLVDNGCIVYDHAQKDIVFYYERSDEISVLEFRRRIGEVLPKYMIPTKYVRLDEMPRNTNGKIDRLKLEEITVQ